MTLSVAFCILLCYSLSSVTSYNAFFIGSRRHKPRWQGHPLTITGGYAPYQEGYHPDLTPYKYYYRPYYYKSPSDAIEGYDSSLEGYDYKDYPDNSEDKGKSYFPDYFNSQDSGPGEAVEAPINDYQQAVMRQNFIDFLIREGPNLYKDHRKMKYMYKATNTYPKPLIDGGDKLNIFYPRGSVLNYPSWSDFKNEERDHNNRTYVYGVPKYSESDEPKVKPKIYTTSDLRKDNPFEINKDANRVNDKDEEVKELESQRTNLQDIIYNYPLSQDEMENEYNPSSVGKSIKDLVSKDNMDENVEINDRPLWKQNDRSWISSLTKRQSSQPSSEQKIIDEKSSEQKTTEQKTSEQKTTDEKTSEQKTTDEKTSEQKATDEKSLEDVSNNIRYIIQPLTTTLSPSINGEDINDGSESNEKEGEEKTNSNNKVDVKHPRDVYEKIKEMMNEEDKFHTNGGFDMNSQNKKKRSFVSTEDVLTKELGALRIS